MVFILFTCSCREHREHVNIVNKERKEDMKYRQDPFRQVGNRYLFYPSEVDAALKGGAAV